MGDMRRRKLWVKIDMDRIKSKEEEQGKTYPSAQ
jgi:hypothetical protein